MDDGSNGVLSEVEAPDCPADAPATAAVIETDPKTDPVEQDEEVRFNGGSNVEAEADNYSSGSDALVIDESVTKQKCLWKKKTNEATTSSGSDKSVTKSELIPHFNPYFGESLFELSRQHHASIGADVNSVEAQPAVHATANSGSQLKKGAKKKNSPKLKEYAQYLGLQPTVQFKCSKCGRAGFESLVTLNHHIIQCTDEPLTQPETRDNSSSFKLTRKVFLCSACGTYYENWNLYLHMIEVHRRYLCLYCLGMFSALDDLCLHIQSRHNFEPSHRNNPEDFFNAHGDPCYIVCCECNKLFNEQENFFYHTCVQRDLVNKSVRNSNLQRLNAKTSKAVKQQIRPEEHVTGDSVSGTVASSIKSPIPENAEDNTNKAEHQLKNNSCYNTCASPDDTNDSLVPSEADNEEILYSSDSELNFKGFDPSGEPVYSEPYCDTKASPASNSETDIDKNISEPTETMETRKVPKLSLKLKPGSYPEISSEDHKESATTPSNDIDEIESENEFPDIPNVEDGNTTPQNVDEAMDEDDYDEDEGNNESEMKIAGPDISIVELELEQPLDKFEIHALLQKCLKATAPFCIYCNHARQIAVNGKQLGLHAIAEHRYAAVVSSITAEELIPESFVSKIKESLSDLENVFLNLELTPSEEAVTFSHGFECFQCRYSTPVHKELYLHNRKMHTKNLLLCIMCKSNFYSYSELICHLCPGVYVLDYDVQFRCCMCVADDLPSSFRLMVHFRKRHHVCDVCLEPCHTQYRLSNHVWKHKLHHFCYRCGIAYRNKPDITRHLFWKHGTESVLCKRCLQKKWPHVYHFCVPPSSFQCEECNSSFSKAMYLKVHKRLHAEDRPHACTVDNCQERFVSKKLLTKHVAKHTEPPPPPPEEKVVEKETVDEHHHTKLADDGNENKTIDESQKQPEEEVKVAKPKIDVYDLPELNLSESDTSDSEDDVAENAKNAAAAAEETAKEAGVDETFGMSDLVIDKIEEDVNDEHNVILDGLEVDNTDTTAPSDVGKSEAATTSHTSDVVIENIWDNFKNYQASKGKFDHLLTEVEKTTAEGAESDAIVPVEDDPPFDALIDHDYCIDPTKQPDVSFTEVKPDLSQSIDHDYCFAKKTGSDDAAAKAETAEVGAKSGSSVKGEGGTVATAATVSPKKNANNSTSDSSSDSDTSCSCGSKCSCSSGTSNSSSTSDSSNSDSSTEEGRKRQQARRARRKQKSKKEGEPATNGGADVNVVDPPVPGFAEIPIRESDLETTESETDEEFYDRQPQKLAKKILEEKRSQLLAGIEPPVNGSILENSRTSTPILPEKMEQDEEEEEEIKYKKKSKSKKKKKKRGGSERKESDSKLIPYYQYYQPQATPPITITLPKKSMMPAAQSSSGKLSASNSSVYSKVLSDPPDFSREESNDSNLRASKRRRVPNKFYGYSSDEEDEKTAPPPPKWRKTEAPTTPGPKNHPPLVVPPLTIKAVPTPDHHPPQHQALKTPSFSNRSRPQQYSAELQVPSRPPAPKQRMPAIRLKTPVRPQPLPPPSAMEDADSDAEESNDSSNEGRNLLNVNRDALYCYCKCPYDEVSEMIGCDASDCSIEWFHFECVGIMVPPKGHWYCPECRKKRQQKRDLLKMKAKLAI